MNKTFVAARVGEATGLSKLETTRALDAALATIAGALRLTGLVCVDGTCRVPSGSSGDGGSASLDASTDGANTNIDAGAKASRKEDEFPAVSLSPPPTHY